MLRGTLLLTPLLLAVFAACGGEVQPPVAEVPARWSTGIAADVGTLERSTGTAFVGEVTDKTQQREQDRFPISTFEVRVDQVISGDVSSGEMVTLEQPGGLAEDHDGRTVQVALEGDAPIEPGVRYLFFATLRDDGVYTTAPFGRYEITDGGRVEAPASWEQLGAASALDELPVDEALTVVRSAAP